MTDTSEIDILIGQIRDTIKGRSDGSLSLEKTDRAYETLLERYHALERKIVSDHPGGFIKGLLYQHNRSNYSAITAVFILKDGMPSPLAFAGDAILFQALPELIVGQASLISDGSTSRFRLGEKSGQSFSMVLKGFDVGGEKIIVSSVTSTPLFDISDFEFLAVLIGAIYTAYAGSFSPVLLDYIHEISSELSGIFESSRDVICADHFTLNNPLNSFSLTGIHALIDFSSFIMETLSRAYPEPVNVLVVSLASYLVIYDAHSPLNAEVKRNRIDINYHTNIVPYKSTHTEIATHAELSHFLEHLR
ncbi:MAG: hypothetical protein E4G96_05160 [Chrysiogenales bacterium]|nr:MAG: hypothetical protein E4G96_05160 [Chrysiogenales bacterium]